MRSLQAGAFVPPKDIPALLDKRVISLALQWRVSDAHIPNGTVGAWPLRGDGQGFFLNHGCKNKHTQII